MNKPVIFITIAVVVMGLLFAAYSFASFQPTVPYEPSSSQQGSSQGTTSASHESTNPAPETVKDSTNASQQLSGKISQSQLASHDVKEDCWVGYKGKAYDITSFLPNHPGGVNAIARHCGTSSEFEQAFTRQHGTSKASMFIKVAIYKGDLE